MSFPFFDLPGELRENILSRLLVRPNGIRILDNNGENAGSNGGGLNNDNDDEDATPPPPSSSPLPYFLTNTQMYREASGLFYTRNDFILDLPTTRRLPDALTSAGGFLGGPPPLLGCGSSGSDALLRRHRVRSLTLLLRRDVAVGDDFETTLAPALGDMVLRGSLRRLAVHVRCWPSLAQLAPGAVSRCTAAGAAAGRFQTRVLRRTARHGEREVMASRPWQVLLQLLADPDLEAVQVWASRVHYGFWCPFHAEEEEEEGGEEEGGAGRRRRPVVAERYGAKWVRLDWRAMVDAFGSGQRIVKVGEGGY